MTRKLEFSHNVNPRIVMLSDNGRDNKILIHQASEMYKESNIEHPNHYAHTNCGRNLSIWNTETWIRDNFISAIIASGGENNYYKLCPKCFPSVGEFMQLAELIRQTEIAEQEERDAEEEKARLDRQSKWDAMIKAFKGHIAMRFDAIVSRNIQMDEYNESKAFYYIKRFGVNYKITVEISREEE